MKFLKHLLLTTLSITAGVSALGQNKTIGFKSEAGTLRLAGNGFNGEILVDGNEHWGVIRAAVDLGSDFGKVTGKNLTVQIENANEKSGKYEYKVPIDDKVYKVADEPGVIEAHGFKTSGSSSNTVIIAGTIGKSAVIDQLISSGKIDVAQVQGKWEAYVSALVENPLPNVAKAVVIAGSDKRGTIFGLYDISEQIGVSPFYYWGDVAPQSHDEIFALNTIKNQGSPSIQYRGLFLNDEAPCLTNWVLENFGRGTYGAEFNRQFYSLVFELILRSRGNYLWPTMWGSMFNVDDYENQPLADAFGIVMGTSHTEPLLRAKDEWPRFGEGIWQWNINEEGIRPFFEYGVQRAKPYEGIYNLGMRGFDDFEMDLDREDAIKVVQSAVKAQRDVLAKVNPETELADIPQMWCIYKEVLGYYEGGMPVPDDVTLLWSDDNWGNIRRLPVSHELERSGGAGLYYHFDYVGDPRDYKWLNTVSLQRTWEQLHLAYERQANKVWILNVGDLKPLELPISYYFDLAYDINRWSYDNIDEWTLLWAEREFGAELSKEIAYLADTFSKYAAWRKFELVDTDNFSILNYNEAEIVLEKWAKLEERAEAVNARLPEVQRAAFFEMILHPIKAGYVVYQIYINAAKNYLFVEQKRSTSNRLAFSVIDLLKADKQLTDDYHDLLDGKWNHMMDQTHLGYNYWQQPMRDALPPVRFVQDQMDALAGTVGIGVEGSYATIPGDDRYHDLGGKVLTTIPMDPYGPKSRYVDVFSRERKCSKWSLESTVDYVTVSPSSGTVCGTDSEDSRAHITVDWTRAPPGNSEAKINFTFVPSDKSPRSFGGTNEGHVGVTVPLNNTKIPSDFKDGFVESDRHISIEAEHFTQNTSSDDAHYVVIPNFGHTLSGVTLFPVLADTQHAPSSPRLEYDIFTFSETTLANITIYTAPSLNFNGEGRTLKYAIAIDDETPKVVQVVPSSEHGQLPEGWEEAVSDNSWKPSSTHLITPGAHKIKVWAIEPGVVFQKLVVDLGGVRSSYFGPPESHRAGKKKEEEEEEIEIPISLRIPNQLGERLPERDDARHGDGNTEDETNSNSNSSPNVYDSKKGTPKANNIYQVLRGSLRLDQNILKGVSRLV